jgi:hypothetical protein
LGSIFVKEILSDLGLNRHTQVSGLRTKCQREGYRQLGSFGNNPEDGRIGLEVQPCIYEQMSHSGYVLKCPQRAIKTNVSRMILRFCAAIIMDKS